MAYENECLRDQFNMRQRGFAAFLKELNIAPMHFFFDKKNHEFGNQTIEMHRFASENQIYTGTVTFKRSRKPTPEKSNLRRKRPIFCHGENFL